VDGLVRVVWRGKRQSAGGWFRFAG